MTGKGITINYSAAVDFFSPHELEYLETGIQGAHRALHEGTGPGSEFTGWLELPSNYDGNEFQEIKNAAEEIRSKAEALVVIGIGGSYLGARAVLDALNHSFYNPLPAEQRQGPQVFFAGNNISSTYLSHLLDAVKDQELYVNVISKSGTTLEPAVAFRLFRNLLEEKYGKEEAKRRIIATTDREKGVLKKLADREGYRTFVVPDNVGGRFSVLTAVGLLPIAVGGIDIDELMEGARSGMELFGAGALGSNPAYQYAALRNLFYCKGKSTEVLVTYEPSLVYLAEWWKQLFGESEGKDEKGLWPASLNFTTDLHSLGQYMQEGRRNLFATTLWVEKPRADLQVPELAADDDGLNYLVGQSLHSVNEKACVATIEAHTAGGVPNLRIELPETNPFYCGQLLYFFEKACAVSGYLLGVNPFDQPGVEAYKQKMFALLGKP